MKWLWVLLILSMLGRGAPLRVLLDFYPNPNHVPLYVAQATGLFAAAGVDIELLVPTDPSDPVKLAAARVADIALTPQMNYLIARGAGLPLLAVGALIDGALGGLLTLREYGIEELGELRGLRIGYSLEPLEPVLWRTMLLTAGVRPSDYELVPVRMNTLSALLSRRVEAIGAFRNYEVLAVAGMGRVPVFFPQEAYGVPETYELIMVIHPALLGERGDELRGFLSAIAEAITFTADRPHEAVALFEAAVPELAGEELTRASFLATIPFYAKGARHDDVGRWEAMQAYLVAHGLMPQALPIMDLITRELLP